MNRVGKRAKYLSVLIGIFLLCAAIFISDYASSAPLWVVHPSNQNIYNNGELTVAGSVYSADGVKLLHSDSNGLAYSDDYYTRLSTLHVIGDKEDNITTGVLSSKRDKLIGYDLLNGLYGASSSDNKIDLTINAELSAFAYQALASYDGALGIYNYETGEILTMVSKPSYDPYNVPNLSSDDYDGVFINRVMNGLYVPGSIMKLVSAYAAIETIPDIYTQAFDCHGGFEIDGEWVKCNGHHGVQTFEQAIANSCNSAFAQITLQLGKDTLSEYAKKAGITSFETIDGVKTSRGRFDVSDANQSNLAWAGIGQYTTLVNPMQYMMFCGAIANDGILKIPHYINRKSFLSSFNLDNSETRLMEATTAEKLTTLMRNNTITTYGDYNFPDLELCAKTGTAEVEIGAPHSWLVGFSDHPAIPLAFVVIVEHGAGSLEAVSVASSVLGKAAKLMNK